MLRKFNIVKEISMSQNHSKIDDTWAEWQDNNSPIHNEAICPLFYTETKNDNAKSIDRNGNYYEVTAEGSLRKNGEFVAHVNNKRFERTELEYKGDLCEWYNGHLYTGVRNDDIIKIYEDGNLVETVYAEEDPLCERLYHGKYFGVYLQTLSSTGTFNFYGWSKSHFGQFGAYTIFDNPTIFVHDDMACVSPSTGSSLKANNLLSVFFYNDVANNVWTLASRINYLNLMSEGTVTDSGTSNGALNVGPTTATHIEMGLDPSYNTITRIYAKTANNAAIAPLIIGGNPVWIPYALRIPTGQPADLQAGSIWVNI